MNQIAGTHLIVDAYVSSPNVLATPHIMTVIDKLVEELRMEKLGEPKVEEVSVQPDLLSTDQDEGGISIIQMITTSHISMHIWPARCAIMMDIFSCHVFNPDVAFDLLRREFDFTDSTHHIVERRDPRQFQNQKVLNCFPWER